jgi:hypothetical protein
MIARAESPGGVNHAIKQEAGVISPGRETDGPSEIAPMPRVVRDVAQAESGRRRAKS